MSSNVTEYKVILAEKSSREHIFQISISLTLSEVIAIFVLSRSHTNHTH